MKKSISLAFTMLLLVGLSSFNTIEKSKEIYGDCFVTVYTANAETGEFSTTSYYSSSRTSAADCRAGARALERGDFMSASDFKNYLGPIPTSD